jgi:hypothetical protein
MGIKFTGHRCSEFLFRGADYLKEHCKIDLEGGIWRPPLRLALGGQII